MSKQVKILLILVVAALAIYFLYTRKPWSSVKGGDETAFAIDDTASIGKVFIADGRGNNTLLKRTENGWTVNDKTTADAQKVSLLLETIHDVKLRNPVGQGEFNNVIKDLTAAGVKVEFYNRKDDLVKTLYVGQMTSDQTGTYMMLEGAKAPYVTHIPGFVGYLTPRFLPRPVKWRSRLVFDLAAEQVANVKVDYADKTQGFEVENKGSRPVVKDAQGNEIILSDTNFVKYYLSGFSQLYGEGFNEIYNQSQQDSIRKTTPYATITVQSKAGQVSTLALHVKPLEKGSKDRFDEDNKLRETDVERYFGFVNNSPELLYIQQYNFGRVLKRAMDFRGR